MMAGESFTANIFRSLFYFDLPVKNQDRPLLKNIATDDFSR